MTDDNNDRENNNIVSSNSIETSNSSIPIVSSTNGASLSENQKEPPAENNEEKPSCLNRIRKFSFRQFLRNSRRFCYNPDNGEIMTKKPMTWLQIIVYLVAVYTLIAIFWTICWAVFWNTQIDRAVVKLKNDAGLIGSSPSLSFKPYLPNYNNIPSSSIEINLDSKNMSDLIGWQKWANRTDEFLKEYRNQNIDLNPLEGCKDHPYGYDKGAPCIYLKLNRIHGIKSIPYNMSNISIHLPKMIEDVIKKGDESNKIWVNCEETGETKYLKMIDHFPQGFSNDDYIEASNNNTIPNPLIAIKLTPKVKDVKTPLIKVQCRAWAQNINYYPSREEEGLLTLKFQILKANQPTTNEP